MSSRLDRQAAEFRALRREVEESILPLATSVDGRRFEFQASLYGLELQVGGYVVLESDDGRRLGQVVALELARVDGSEMSSGDEGVELRTRMTLRSVRGEGVVLDGDGRAFPRCADTPGGSRRRRGLAGDDSACEGDAVDR